MTQIAEPQTKTLSVRDAIESRRSIRDYDPNPIPESDVREILRLTGLAPSSSNTQPWRFVVVTNKEVRASIRAAAFNQRQLLTAPVVIAVVADGEDMLAQLEQTAHPNMHNDPAALDRYVNGTRNRMSGMPPEARAKWAAGQAFIAVGYLSLAAQSLGYATSIMGGFDPAKVKEMLDIPGHAEVAALIALGRATEEGFPHHRHPVESITRWVK
jgi:nitroreductase